MKDNLVDIPEQKLDSEAEEILRDLAEAEASDPELASLEVSEEMEKDFHERLHALMQKRERAQEDELLLAQMSEEGREAYQLGKEMMAQKLRDEESKEIENFSSDAENSGTDAGSVEVVESVEATEDIAPVVEIKSAGKHPRRRMGRRSRRVYAVVALAAMLVLAFGLTSFGGRTYVMDRINRVLNGGSNYIAMDTEEGERQYSEMDMEEVYLKISKELGIEMVVPDYLPKGYAIEEIDINKEGQFAYLSYADKDTGWIHYFMYTNHRDQSISIYQDDECIETEESIISDVSIQISKYKNPENIIYYYARFSYNNVNYELSSNIKYSEFEKILKNLFFI
jgi:hypothetical protein